MVNIVGLREILHCVIEAYILEIENPYFLWIPQPNVKKSYMFRNSKRCPSLAIDLATIPSLGVKLSVIKMKPDHGAACATKIDRYKDYGQTDY